MWRTRLFPSEIAINKSVLINGQLFKVVGVKHAPGKHSFGLFSWDSMVAMPLAAFNKYYFHEHGIGCPRESERQNKTGRREMMNSPV
jgi:hypothetical protein